MIKVRYDFDNHEIRVSGHANMEEKGKDIVCASVSTLVYTLCRTLSDAQEQGILEDLIVEAKSGKAHVKCVPKEDYEPNVDTIFMTIFNGFDALAESYPDYVSFVPMG